MNVRPLPPQGSALAKLSYAPLYKNFSLYEDNCQELKTVHLALLYIRKIFITLLSKLLPFIFYLRSGDINNEKTFNQNFCPCRDILTK